MASQPLPTRPETQKRRAVPSYPHIIKALNMVRDEADIAEIEAELKADPVISYRLMMHVNSAGMGFPRQIKSYRQAISILGFHQLYRWLVRLLVTADPSDRGSAIGRNAVIRGRFLELVGKAQPEKYAEEELFVVGAFSLLEVLFGEPMEMLLEDLRISEPVRSALVARAGSYAPLLRLAEAIETTDEPKIAAAMDELPDLPIDLIFETYAQALAWAESLDG
jgi:EAL and modified HD-GYP domain-containing signal transduction protein